MQVVYPVCCGIDVHQAQLTACLRQVDGKGHVTQVVREFGTTTAARHKHQRLSAQREQVIQSIRIIGHALRVVAPSLDEFCRAPREVTTWPENAGLLATRPGSIAVVGPEALIGKGSWVVERSAALVPLLAPQRCFVGWQNQLEEV